MRRLEQVLVTVDQLAPDVDRIIMTQDTINEFSDQYTNVIKEVTDALESFKFKAKPNQAADFEKQVRVIIDCIEVFKRVLVTPNNEAFTAATIRACEAIEKSCVDIYRIMPLELDLTLRVSTRDFIISFYGNCSRDFHRNSYCTRCKPSCTLCSRPELSPLWKLCIIWSPQLKFHSLAL